MEPTPFFQSALRQLAPPPVASALNKLLKLEEMDAVIGQIRAQSAPATFPRELLRGLKVSVRVREWDLARIPAQGPLLVTANHPFGMIEGAAILDVLQEKAPGAVVILMGIFPRNDAMSVMPLINKINDNLSKFADGKKIRYLNINDKLADGSGRLFDGMMNSADKLHPSIKGYQVWADALKPIFIELLGPPSPEDHAPPPTGDPRVQVQR